MSFNIAGINLNYGAIASWYRMNRSQQYLHRVQLINRNYCLLIQDEPKPTIPPPSPARKQKLYELTTETFDDYIATDQHFIKFYAPWCSHCKILAPTWNLLAEAFKTDELVSVAKVCLSLCREMYKIS